MQMDTMWQNWSYRLLFLTILKIILTDNTQRGHTVYSVVHLELKKDDWRMHIKLYITLMTIEWKCINFQV